MSTALVQVLEIDVALNGATKLNAWVDDLSTKLIGANRILITAAAGLGLIGEVFYNLKKGMEQAGKTETMIANLQAWTHSVVTAGTQMAYVEWLASKGIFGPRENIYEAVRLMDEAHISLNKNRYALEGLALRTGSIESAARVIERIAGSAGGLGRVMMQLNSLNITPEMLREHGVNVKGLQILSPKEEVLRALNEIGKADPIRTKLQSTLGAATGEFVYQLKKLFESLATPILHPFTRFVHLLTDALELMKDLNNVTRGWAGMFIEGGMLLMGVRAIWGMFEKIQLSQKISVAWAWAQATAAWVTSGGLKAAWATLSAIKDVQALIAVFSAAFAAAYGNLLPLAILAGAGIIAGGAIYGMDKGLDWYEKSREKNFTGDLDSSEQSANRPYRRDDIENINKRMRGRAWTG